jgi:RNA polymerase sigma-70 factor (ECF subfamily)
MSMPWDGAFAARQDDRLLAQVAAGDRDAFRTLMSRHTASMVSLAQRTTGSIDEADEIVQDAFLKVWTTAPNWRGGGPAKFSTWLYRVVLNASLDYCRRKPSLPLDQAGDPVDTSADGFDCMAARQRWVLLSRAMASLPDRQHEALSLHYFSDLSAAKGAEVLGVSLSAFEALLVRGKRGLRDSLAGMGLTRIEDLL